jgi:hypothetical protein
LSKIPLLTSPGCESAHHATWRPSIFISVPPARLDKAAKNERTICAFRARNLGSCGHNIYLQTAASERSLTPLGHRLAKVLHCSRNFTDCPRIFRGIVGQVKELRRMPRMKNLWTSQLATAARGRKSSDASMRKQSRDAITTITNIRGVSALFLAIIGQGG